MSLLEALDSGTGQRGKVYSGLLQVSPYLSCSSKMQVSVESSHSGSFGKQSKYADGSETTETRVMELSIQEEQEP